jgi:hypothetical protein
MSVTFHPDGGFVIDDPEIERTILELCRLTGETPERVVDIAVSEALGRIACQSSSETPSI